MVKGVEIVPTPPRDRNGVISLKLFFLNLISFFARFRHGFMVLSEFRKILLCRPTYETYLWTMRTLSFLSFLQNLSKNRILPKKSDEFSSRKTYRILSDNRTMSIRISIIGNGQKIYRIVSDNPIIAHVYKEEGRLCSRGITFIKGLFHTSQPLWEDTTLGWLRQIGFLWGTFWGMQIRRTRVSFRGGGDCDMVVRKVRGLSGIVFPALRGEIAKYSSDVATEWKNGRSLVWKGGNV